MCIKVIELKLLMVELCTFDLLSGSCRNFLSFKDSLKLTTVRI